MNEELEAKATKKKPRGVRGGIWTEDSGVPAPTDPEGVKNMAKGGSASARADGIASRGKTKGTIVAMCGGGYMKK